MKRRVAIPARTALRALAGWCAASAMLGAAACIDINTDPKSVAAVSLDSVAAPAIVIGDSLRDSLGVARPLRGSAYNLQRAVLTGVPVRYRTADSTVTVDSITGYVVSRNTGLNTPVRLIVEAAGLQSAPDTVYVVPRPDTAYAVNPADSIVYAVTDSTPILSNPITVNVSSRAQGLPVHGWLVSYRMLYPSDTMLVRIVGRDGVHAATLDTTDASGNTGDRLRFRPLAIKSATDSVVIVATVLYKGAPLPGTPLRFVYQVKP